MNFYAFIPKLLNMSLTASVAIVFVLLLRLMLKKTPKVISYALWAVVLFRLLCPVSIESSFSLFGLMDAPTTESNALTTSIEYVPENIVHAEYPAVTLPVPGVSDAINDTLPSGREQLVADPLEAPVTLATYVWIAGVLVMAAYSVVSYRRLRQKLLTASPLRDNIYLADEITSPFVMGLVRPKIYLPSDMEEREQAYIIRHEQHHIRRGDHIIKALAFLALSIHWFNPLVWVAFIYSNKDMEMSCDEAVVKKMGTGILADYTASLLSLATGKHIIAGMPLAFGEGDTKGRIRNLANWRKPAFWVVLAAVIACIALAVGLMTNPANNDDSDPSEDGYFLLIGADGVESIEISGVNSSGGVVNADGSAFKNGEKVWLEPLQDITDLRGYSITALGKNGEILYALTIPEGATNDEVINLVGSDGWLLAPTDFEVLSEKGGEETSAAVVKWTYSPMMSATWHAEFRFNFEFDYSHMDVSCDNGNLLNLDVKRQSGEKELRLEMGERFCWRPEIGSSLTDVSESAAISFAAYDGGEVLYAGTLDIIRTGTENGQSFYEARLEGTDLLTLQQKEGNMGAAVILTGNAGTAEQENGLSIRQVQENAVWFTPEDIHDIEYMELVWHDGQRFTPLTGEGYEYVKTRLSSAKEIGATGCPYHSVLYIHRSDGVVGKVLPAEDSCDVFLSDGKYYQFGDREKPPYYDSNETFYNHFGTSVEELPHYTVTPVAVDYYEMVTSESAEKVEQFATDVKNDILSGNWESVSKKIAYPIQIDGRKIENSSAFLDMNLDDTLSRKFLDAVADENCHKMFFNSQGIMMGATGQIWIASVEVSENQWELKVTALNGMIDNSLPAEELEDFNALFEPILYDKRGEPIGVNPWSCFFTSYYDDVRDLNFEEFMRYFPGDGSTASEAEFASLKSVEAWPFSEVETLDDMPVPVHKYPVRLVNLVLGEYAGISVDDLDTSAVAYLSVYDAYYNYTSDFGPGMFVCTRGERNGDTVYLYEELEQGTDLLILLEQGDSYRVVAHQHIADR